MLINLRNSLFPSIDRKNKMIDSLQQEIAVLQQQLRESTQLYRDEVARENNLLKEIEYLYQIFIYRSHYRFQLHIFPKQPPVLLTVGKKKHQTSFVLYVPSLCKEVATVTARPVDTTLVIDTMEIDALIEDNSPLSILFAQEIIAEAKATGMEQLANTAGQTVAVGFTSTQQLCSMIGLAMPSQQEQPAGDRL